MYQPSIYVFVCLCVCAHTCLCVCISDTFLSIMVLCSLKVFAFAGIVGTIFLLPVNYMGTQICDDSESQKTSLDSFSISNVNNGSHR